MANTKKTEPVNQQENHLASFRRLFEMKKEIPTFKRESKNDYTNSSYTDLKTILEILEPIFQKHEFLLTNKFDDYVLTVCLYDLKIGYVHENSIQISNNDNPQKIGSQLTYYRRYLLSCLLSLKTEDDDGNEGAGKPKKVIEKKASYNPLTKKEINTIHGKIIACMDLDQLTELYNEDPRHGTNKEVKQLFVKQKNHIQEQINS